MWEPMPSPPAQARRLSAETPEPTAQPEESPSPKDMEERQSRARDLGSLGSLPQKPRAQSQGEAQKLPARSALSLGPRRASSLNARDPSVPDRPVLDRPAPVVPRDTSGHLGTPAQSEGLPSRDPSPDSSASEASGMRRRRPHHSSDLNPATRQQSPEGDGYSTSSSTGTLSRRRGKILPTLEMPSVHVSGVDVPGPSEGAEGSRHRYHPAPPRFRIHGVPNPDHPHPLAASQSVEDPFVDMSLDAEALSPNPSRGRASTVTSDPGLLSPSPVQRAFFSDVSPPLGSGSGRSSNSISPRHSRHSSMGGGSDASPGSDTRLLSPSPSPVHSPSPLPSPSMFEIPGLLSPSPSALSMASAGSAVPLNPNAAAAHTVLPGPEAVKHFVRATLEGHGPYALVDLITSAISSAAFRQSPGYALLQSMALSAGRFTVQSMAGVVGALVVNHSDAAAFWLHGSGAAREPKSEKIKDVKMKAHKTTQWIVNPGADVVLGLGIAAAFEQTMNWQIAKPVLLAAVLNGLFMNRYVENRLRRIHVFNVAEPSSPQQPTELEDGLALRSRASSTGAHSTASSMYPPNTPGLNLTYDPTLPD